MKKILLCFMLFCHSFLFAQIIHKQKPKHQKPQYQTNIVPKKMTVAEKKARFFALVAPAVDRVYNEFDALYRYIKREDDTLHYKAQVAYLKIAYKAKSREELLMALKPHPRSIALAQAAMESAWATSRFFVQAKNIFGMWSVNKNEPRIAAGSKRNGTRTIWLKKFSSVRESVHAYYVLLSRGRAYKKFRKLNYENKDALKVIEGLDTYSEKGQAYIDELGSMIRYNKLTKYDH